MNVFAFSTAQFKAEGPFWSESCQSAMYVVVNYNQKCESHNCINSFLTPLAKVTASTAETVKQLRKSSFMKNMKFCIITPDLNFCVSAVSVQPFWSSWLHCDKHLNHLLLMVSQESEFYKN